MVFKIFFFLVLWTRKTLALEGLARLLLPPVWRLTCLFFAPVLRACCCRQYEGWTVCFCPCLWGYLVYCISKMAVAASMKVDLSVFALVLDGIWSIVSASWLLPPVWRLTCLFLPLSLRVFGLLYQQAGCCRQYEGWPVCFLPLSWRVFGLLYQQAGCCRQYEGWPVCFLPLSWGLAVAASMKVELSVFAPVLDGIWSIVLASLLLPPVWRLTCLFLPLSWRVFGLLY